MRHHKKKKYRKCNNCGKTRYPSHPIAVDTAAWRMSQTPGTTISVYECPVVAGSYHLTKVNPLHYQRYIKPLGESPPTEPGPRGRQ